MILYLDSSSLSKLYLEEEGSAEVRRLVSEAAEKASSLIAYAELRAAIGRALRMGRVESFRAQEARREFEADWRDLVVLEVDESIVRVAGDAADRHGLRGFDAVHLASAARLRNATSDTVLFSSADSRLTRAAQAEGLAIA